MEPQLIRSIDPMDLNSSCAIDNKLNVTPMDPGSWFIDNKKIVTPIDQRINKQAMD